MIDIHEIISRINAMREQEDRTERCQNYFEFCSNSSDVDTSCRKAMANWCYQVADTLGFSHETVSLTMSFLDRYLSSRRGRSQEALDSRNMFQLVAITCFYTAVKTYEPVELGVDLLCKMCRGFYSEADIISMERDILFALDWRVSGPTPMDFVRHLIELLPSCESKCSLIENAEKYMDQTTTDLQFSYFKPSVVGASCLISSFTQTHCFDSDELDSFRVRLSQMIDLADVMELQKKLNVDTSICLPKLSSKTKDVSTMNRRRSITISSTSSPVCVTHTRAHTSAAA